MTLCEQMTIAKSMGFKFEYISATGRVYLIVNNNYSIELTQNSTKSKLLTKLDRALMISHIRLHRDEINRVDSIACNRRKQFKVISGGMSWAPIGLKIGQPQGKLRLVA